MKNKGQALHENFYIKVHCSAIKAMIGSSVVPIMSDWDEKTTFLTIDRTVFYLIPKSKVCLTSALYSSPGDLYGSVTFLSSLYPKTFQQVTLTGDQFAGNLADSVILEVKTPYGLRYIESSSLSLFPKKYILAVSSENGPVFVLSSLRTLLGGIWPLKHFQKADKIG